MKVKFGAADDMDRRVRFAQGAHALRGRVRGHEVMRAQLGVAVAEHFVDGA